MNRDDEETPETWRLFADRLRRFVHQRVPHGDGDDVVQEILLKLHQNIGQLEDDSRIEAWAWTIARRTIADYYRARYEEASEADVESITDDDHGSSHRGFGEFAGNHSVHEEVLTWIRPAVDQLPEKYREPLILAEFDGLGQQEIADRLGLSLSGAKSRIQRARALLAAEIDRCCELALDSEGKVVDFRRRRCDC